MPQEQHPPVENQGLFHMIGRIWSTGTTMINAVHDLAETANMHTQHIKLTTQVELNAELQDLRKRLTVDS